VIYFKKHRNVLRCHNDLVFTHNIAMLSADLLWLCFGWIIFHENGGCLSLNSKYNHLQIYSFTLKKSSKFVHFVTQFNLPPTSSAAAFYMLFELEKHMMLVYLTFHKLQFQNRSWDLPNLNLVQIMEYRCMCCMLQQYILKTLCQ